MPRASSLPGRGEGFQLFVPQSLLLLAGDEHGVYTSQGLAFCFLAVLQCVRFFCMGSLQCGGCVRGGSGGTRGREEWRGCVGVEVGVCEAGARGKVCRQRGIFLFGNRNAQKTIANVNKHQWMTQSCIYVPLRTTASHLAPNLEYGSVDHEFQEDIDALIQRIYASAETMAFQDRAAAPVVVKCDEHVVQSWALVRLMHVALLDCISFADDWSRACPMSTRCAQWM